MKNFTTERIIPAAARTFIDQLRDLEEQAKKNNMYVRTLEGAFTIAYMTEYSLGNTTQNSKFWEELLEEVQKQESAIEKQEEIQRIREAVRQEMLMAQSGAMDHLHHQHHQIRAILSHKMNPCISKTPSLVFRKLAKYKGMYFGKL